MATVNKEQVTKEMIEKAMQCKSADELIALAKGEGYELTKEEAEAYITELADFELDGEMLKNVAGGYWKIDCPEYCDRWHHTYGCTHYPKPKR